MAKITTIGDYFTTAQGIVPQTGTSTLTGSAIDRLTYDHALVTLSLGAVAGTAPTHDVKVQTSTTNASTGFADYTPNYVYGNNNSSYTTAAFPQKTAAGISKLDVDLQNASRYIRFVDTVAGATAGVVSVDVLLGQREGTIPGSTG